MDLPQRETLETGIQGDLRNKDKCTVAGKTVKNWKNRERIESLIRGRPAGSEHPTDKSGGSLVPCPHAVQAGGESSRGGIDTTVSPFYMQYLFIFYTAKSLIDITLDQRAIRKTG